MYTKDEIKIWLRKNKKTRQWLADQLGVSKGTIDGYLSNKPIPLSSQSIMNELFKPTSSPEISFDSIISFPVRMTKEEWDNLCEKTGVSNQGEAETMVRKLLEKVAHEAAENTDLL